MKAYAGLVRSRQGVARYDGQLCREQLNLVHRILPVVLAANLINGSLIVVLFSDRIARPLLAGWWLLMIVIIAARFGGWFWYRSQSATEQMRRRWGTFSILGSGATGVLWGTAGVLFYVPGDFHLVVLGLVLGGMGAGALLSLAPQIWAFYAYLVPSVLPFTVKLATIGSADHWAMAAMCAIYVLALMFLGWRAHSWLTRSLILGYEKASFVQTLQDRVQERTEELRDISERLSRDIADRQRAEAKLSDYEYRQAAVADFGRRALSGVELSSLFSEAVSLVAGGLGAAGAAILELSSDQQMLFVRTAAGAVFAHGVESPLPAGKGSPGGFAVQEQAPAVSEDLGTERRFAVPAMLRHAGATSIAAVTIADAGRTFGVLEAYATQSRRFSTDDISFLQSIANMLAAAIDRKRAEQNIRRLALEDPLTGLPNRILFRDRLSQCVASARHRRRLLAVMLLDLDHFKDVNDTLGHPSGDRLLAAVAARLRTCSWDNEPPARLGGDEFALILVDVTDREHAAAIARKVIGSMAEPFFVDGHEIRLGASIGITICPNDDDDPDNLLRNADLALYRAKEGRNMYEFYEVEMAAEVESRKSLERDLRWALSDVGDGGLDVYYQPQISLRELRVAATEALLRWEHPKRGFLLPDTFIPVAEMSGLVVPLGAWVLKRACEQASAWRRRGLPPLVMAVNLSLSQCRRGDLVTSVEHFAERAGCDLNWLELEVTEQLFMPREGAACVDSLRRLQKLGVTVSIDDFGTGYSSLGRLQGLPVDKIKIDKCFVDGVGRRRAAEPIVRAMIALGRSLGLTVVAEGVETQEQLDFLAAEGCHGVQGFLLAPPLPAPDIAKLLSFDFMRWTNATANWQAEALVHRHRRSRATA